MITDSEGNVIQSVSFYTYAGEGTIYEEVTLVAGLNYKFILRDSVGDTFSGHVFLFLGDKVDNTKILGYYERYNHGSFSYSYDIFFQAGNAGILTNVFPTSAPIIAASNTPSQMASNFPSLEPTSPTASPAPTKDKINILIEITLDYYPYATWWTIADSKGNIIQQVDAGVYLTPYATVYEEVTLDADLDYTFTLRDSYYGARTDGRVVLYLGDKVDINKVVAYWDRSQEGSFSYSYDIFFQAGDEGILSNIFPTSAPTITASALPSMLPSISPSNSPTITPSFIPTDSHMPTSTSQPSESDASQPQPSNAGNVSPGFVALGFTAVVIILGFFFASARALKMRNNTREADSLPPVTKPMSPRPTMTPKDNDVSESVSESDLEC